MINVSNKRRMHTKRDNNLLRTNQGQEEPENHLEKNDANHIKQS
jgi:hypothetical protein